MPEQTQKIRIFIASPGDVSKEREILKSVIDELNTTIAPYKGLSLDLVKWETHATPSMGRAQGVINSQLGKYDIFIGIMWKRFGTPTGRADSGTQEEFQLAFEKWKETKSIRILFYFCQAPFMPRAVDEITQLQKVVEFREFLADLGLTWEYSDSEDFHNVVRPHLARILLDTPANPKKYDTLTTTPSSLETPSTPIKSTMSDSVTIGDSAEVSVVRKKTRIFTLSSSDNLVMASELSFLLESMNLEVIRFSLVGAFTAGRTILEELSSTLAYVDAAIVLFGNESQPGNLIFGLGIIQGKLGVDKTIILGPENSKLPSDLLGSIYLRYSKQKMESIKLNLRRELQHMGLITEKNR